MHDVTFHNGTTAVGYMRKQDGRMEAGVFGSKSAAGVGLAAEVLLGVENREKRLRQRADQGFDEVDNSFRGIDRQYHHTARA